MAFLQMFLLNVFTWSRVLASSIETQIIPPYITTARVAAILWSVTLFEHEQYTGHKKTIEGDFQTCRTLSGATLCLDEEPTRFSCKVNAADAVSSVKFKLGTTCVKAYRDLHCYGVPIELLDSAESCSVNLNGETCYNMNDVIGSISSCDYGECKFINWPEDILYSYLHELDFRWGLLDNITKCINELELDLDEYERMLCSGNVCSRPFFGGTVYDRYSSEEIADLKELQRRLLINETFILSKEIDPQGTLSQLNNTNLLVAVETGLAEYNETDEHYAHFHRDLRAYTPLPSKASLKSGNTVYIEYKYIGAVQVQSHIFALLTPSALNQGRCTRTNFKPGVKSFADRMKDLEYIPGLDDRAHAVGSCLGGPAENWNLLPQAKDINRGDKSGANWRVVENNIKDWLIAANCNWVEWELKIHYRGKSTRPDRFKLVATYFEEINQIVFNPKTDVLVCNNHPSFVKCNLRTF
jgi:DNA/RNA non-specific endonuclease